ncbi:MAG: hypothetical protein GY845_14930 [Planctomycetes bacterium]|nr:hypothetical protein [Planctomycetota bacterium]
MSSIKNTEKRIKNVNIVIDSERNKKVFSNILQGFEKSKAKECASAGPNIWRIILKNPLTKIAAAAVIILAVSFVSTRQIPDEQEQHKITKVTKPPVEMMTAISLERAFRRGGIEALENQCEQALKLLGTRTDGFSSQELLSEFNGS